MQLLDEAAQAAKDFAGEPDRAIGYLQQLYALDPSNATLASSLERLLERQERWEDLVGLWTSRLDVQSSTKARETRLRMAELFLDKVGEPDRALEHTVAVLEDSPEHKPAFGLLERLLSSEAASDGVRRQALSRLKQHFLDKKKPKDVVRVLQMGLPCVAEEERRTALRELVERQVDLGDDAGALRHQAMLLAIEPMPTEREALRVLAERTRDYGSYAQALIDAAEGCEQASAATELRMEAARTLEDELSDEARAIELYRGIFDADVPSETKADAGRRVIPLLERTEREAETLDVLSRMSELEVDESARKVLLGKVARLAEKLGESDRARKAWAARVGDDTEDVEALNALIDAASAGKEWARLAELLEQRIKAPAAAERRREDLVRLAQIHAERLEDLDAAIAVWRRVQESFGEDMESVSALTDLLARAERWEDLAEALSQAAAHQIRHFTELQTRLGDAYRQRLGKPELASARYRSALQVDPVNAAARAGQQALLDDESCRPLAVDALAEAYAQTGEWDKTLELLEPRLLIEESETARAEILIEAAELYEDRANDLKAALSCLTRAFALIPDDRGTEKEIRRLAERLDAWEAVVQAYRSTIGSFEAPTPRVGELRFHEGRTLEDRLQDDEGALQAYAQAVAICPDRVEFAVAAARVAAGLSRWDEAARHALCCMAAREKLQPELISTLEQIAGDADDFGPLCEALTAALSEQAQELAPALARTLHATAARWHASRSGDAEAAEASFIRAVQADGTHAETLRALADLQREHPGEPLVDTLFKLAEVERDNLDPVFEAASVAAEAVADAGKREEIFRLLFDTAAAMFRGGVEAAGDATVAQCASWAADQLVALLGERGEHARAQAVLLSAASLPFDDELRTELMHRAAALSRKELDDTLRAIALYRDILQLEPQDARAQEALASAFQESDRLPELLMLRRHQLERERDTDKLLELRLEIASILGEMEARGGRVQTLLDNLQARPGHLPTIEALTSVLSQTHRHGELADLLVKQARVLSKVEATEDAAQLLRRAAGLFEGPLGDVDSAILAYKQLHELEPEGDASAALARLHRQRGQHAMAARWLEVRLGTAPPDTRAVTAVELARAQLDAEQPEQARASLEQALHEDVSLQSARDMLADVYRREGAHEPLARLLIDAGERAADPQQQIALLQEGADLYFDTLGTPERAVDALKRAYELSDDRGAIGVRLAEALRLSGRHDEARAVLEQLIDAFGRKRSSERAELHFQLARVLHAAGEAEGAFEQLETATKMDLAHAPAMHMMARLSQEQGDLERAERAYRGLLMLVRRNPPKAIEDVGPSEVFFELSVIAASRDDGAQSEELLESAMEAATQNDVEARRFQRVLTERGDTDLLMRLLDARLKFAREPRVEAEILASKAGVLAVSLGKEDEALAALLKALELDPDSDAIHAQASELAASMEELERYIKTITRLADDNARRRDAESKRLSARLNLRLGEVIERQLGDLDRAAGLYARVEASGQHVVDAWMAMARVSGARGDSAEQRRVLQRITALKDDEVSEVQRRDALYALAALELADDERRDEGVATLQRAIEGATDLARAKQLLRDATAAVPAHDALSALFERVARESGDDEMLLEHFERLAGQTRDLERLREGIDLALRMGEHARGEKMLKRAAELARSLDEGKERTTWVFSGLADCRNAVGDRKGAMHYLREAVDAAEDAEAETLARELAETAAGEGGDLEIAASAYTRLLERDRGDRTLWQPLLDVYRKMGDRARFEGFAEELLGDLLGPDERAAVHMARARYLIEVERDDRSAIPVLRALLDDAPGHIQATDVLTELYQKHGMNAELADLLQGQFDRARDEQNVEATAELGLRIGDLYGDERPEDAVDAYRAALEWSPEHEGLLRALLAHLSPESEPRDRAELIQPLLRSAEGDEAAALALEAERLWTELYETELAQEALERGVERAPEHQELRDRLEAFYAEREQWRELAGLLERDAERLGDTPQAVVRLKNAASLYRDNLEDLEAAAGALRKALAIVPDDVTLLGELARNLAAAGQQDAAIEDVSRLLEDHPEQDAMRGSLLRVRADLYLQVGRVGDAVEDLDAAYALSPEETTSPLIDALERLKTEAFTTGDAETERRCALRLVQVHDAAGSTDEAREALSDWVEQTPSDVEALRALRARDEEAERWDDVVSSCARLIEVLQGDDRVEAALGLADASERAGRPEAAREGLEQVYRDEPESAVLRARLRELYERVGARAELAQILLADAAAESDEAQRVELFQQAARLYLELGDPGAALGPLGEASKLSPDDHETRVLMIDIQIQLGKLDEAAAMLEESIAAHKRRRSPELAALHQRMARLVAAQGDTEGQLKWLNQALETDRKSGPIASELAEAAIAMANYDAAMKALRSITMMEDPKPITRAMAFLKQAQIAHVRGDTRRAQHWARKAKSLDETLEEVDAFLAEIGA
jgi:tetratricopeptide (TPR) repeat protein